MGARRCEVWLAEVGAERPEHLDLLAPVERDRRARYRRPVDQARFTVGTALLRTVAGARLGQAPGRVRVDRSCLTCGGAHGKPSLPDAGGTLHLSLSHSGDLVLVAATGVAALGVDVELIAERDVAGLSRLVLGPDERLDQPVDFFTYWCRKESAVKATGDGLRVALSQVAVSPPDQPARLLSYAGAPLVASMCDLTVRPGYAAALTVLSAELPEVVLRDGAALLAG